MSNQQPVDSENLLSLIDSYHIETQEARANWYALREPDFSEFRKTVSELIPMFEQADSATRTIAGERLSVAIDMLGNRIHKPEKKPLVDAFTWSHTREMNIYNDDHTSRTNARSFAGCLSQLGGTNITREQGQQIIIQLYGSNISHIGPGITGLFYMLQPCHFPLFDRKGIAGLNWLFHLSVRSGKEGLKHIAEHMPLIWGLVDRYGHILDQADMADVSGFLHWLGLKHPQANRVMVKEIPPDFSVSPAHARLTLSAVQLKSGIQEIIRHLAIDPSAIEQAVIHLMMGKSLILTGPPGTGKTELARLLPQVFWNRYPKLETALSEWTTYEVIGGLFPTVVRSDEGLDKIQLSFRRGCVYEAIMLNWMESSIEARESPTRRRYIKGDEDQSYDGVWLIIDEFNRADIDRAFGPLFTALETGILTVPSGQEGPTKEIPIPDDFRIIGTLNTFDKHHLFDMSDALKRRFAFVEILPHPDRKIEEQMILERVISELGKHHIQLDETVLHDMTHQLMHWIQFVRIFRMIGTAQVISILTYVGLRIAYLQTPESAIEEGIKAHLVDQLDSLTQDQLQPIIKYSEGHYEALFAFFEQMNRRQNQTRLLHQFARYLSRISTGAANLTAARLLHITDASDDETFLQLDAFFMGDEKTPGWRDVFTGLIKGPVMPGIARTLQGMSDERF